MVEFARRDQPRFATFMGEIICSFHTQYNRLYQLVSTNLVVSFFCHFGAGAAKKNTMCEQTHTILRSVVLLALALLTLVQEEAMLLKSLGFPGSVQQPLGWHKARNQRPLRTGETAFHFLLRQKSESQEKSTQVQVMDSTTSGYIQISIERLYLLVEDR